MPQVLRGCRAVLCGILIAFLVTACGGREARIAKHYQRAKEHLQQQDYAKAKVELRNVLQIEPLFSDAYFMGGQIAELEDDWNAAYANYEKALEVKPADSATQLKLARIYLLYGELEKAEKSLQASLAGSPEGAESKTVRAAIRAARGDYDAAISDARSVLSTSPGREDTISLLAGAHKKVGDMKSAEQTLVAGTQANPSSVGLRLDLASLFVQSNLYDRAEKPLTEIVKLAPNVEEHQMRLAAYYSNGGRLDQAESILRTALAADSKNERRVLALAEFLARQRGPAKAEVELKAFLAKHEDAVDVRLALAGLYLSAKQTDQAEAVFREAIEKASREGDKAKVRNRFAEYFSTRGKLDEAQALVDELLKKNARDEAALLTRGRIALSKRDPVSAISDFRSLLRSEPDSIEYLSLLARAHLMNKEAALAREALAQAVERNPADSKVRTLWIDFLASSGEYQKALNETDKALAKSPLDPDLLQLKASIQALTRDTKAAEQTMEQLKAAGGGRASGYHQMGAFYLANKKYEAAIVEFNAALGLAPKAFDSLCGLVKSHIGLGSFDQASARVRDAYKDNPSSNELAYLSGEIFIAQGRLDQAEKSLRAAIAAKSDWATPYLALRKILTDRQDFKAAEESLRQGLQAMPNDPLLLFSLARTLELSKDYRAAVETYEALLKANAEMDIAANNLAILLVERLGDKASTARALELATRFDGSSNAIFLDTFGWVQVRSGQFDRGVDSIKKAIDLMPTQPEFHYHLAVASQRRGDVSSARKSIESALASPLEFSERKEARALLAELAGKRGQTP